MSFEITSAKYNCSDNTIDIEYIGKYDNRRIMLHAHIGKNLYNATLSGKKLIPSTQLPNLDGYSIYTQDPDSHTPGSPTANAVFDCFLFVYCNSSCIDIPITEYLPADLENGDCFFEGDIQRNESNYNCDSLIAITVNTYRHPTCELSSYTHNWQFPIEGGDLFNYVSGMLLVYHNPCDFVGYYIWQSFLNYNPCTRCLLSKYDFKRKLAREFLEIRYNCTLGLFYKQIQGFDISFDGGTLPPTGTKLKNGKYKVSIKKCPKTTGSDCDIANDCFDLVVNCTQAGNKFEKEVCIENSLDIVSIDETGLNCGIKITNKINQVIKVKRELLSSFDRSCSGSVTNSFNEITLFPLQSAIISNECFGYDARLSIEYQSGVNICSNTLCLPYCDLSAINETSDIKAPTVNGCLIKDGKVVSFFNPLENGHSNVSIYIGDDVFSGLIPPGGYYVFKIPYSTKSFEYRLTTNKNNEVEFIGTFNGTFSSEIKTGIPYSYIEDGQIYTKTT